jgi:hypothetical protein
VRLRNFCKGDNGIVIDSFAFEIFNDFREMETTFVIAESARSCRISNEPVRPVSPMNIAITSRALYSAKLQTGCLPSMNH